MSSGDRIPREKALILAEGVVSWLSGDCDQMEIVGSIRRERETVGDIEIVCRPNNTYQFNATLDALIKAKTIRKKTYQRIDGHGKRIVYTRWGDKLKSFIIEGVTCELYIADADAYGYIKWLRTGPGDANQYVVTRMKQEKSAMRFDSGYGWITSYNGEYPNYETKLHLPDEETVFKLLGLGEVINPKWRRDDVYRHNWKGVLPAYALHPYKADEPKQRKLF